MKKIKNIFSKISILILIVGILSCSENEIISKYHFNDIQEFKTEINGKTIYANIEGDEIVINWPQKIEKPKTIIPSIIVSERANISPNSEIEINFKQDFEFVVTAEDGTTKTYKLKIKELQPKLAIDDIEEKIEANFTYSYRVYGEGFSKDPIDNKVFLVSEDGKETPLKVFDVITSNNNGYGSILQIKIPKKTEISEGKYKLKVAFNKEVFTTKDVYFDIKDLKLPILAEIKEDQIEERDGVRCLVVKVNDGLLLKGENLNSLDLNQMFGLYSNSSGGGQDAIDASVINDTTISFNKSFWSPANIVYQKALVTYHQPGTRQTIDLYIHDTKGDFVGIYFEY